MCSPPASLSPALSPSRLVPLTDPSQPAFVSPCSHSLFLASTLSCSQRPALSEHLFTFCVLLPSDHCSHFSSSTVFPPPSRPWCVLFISSQTYVIVHRLFGLETPLLSHLHAHSRCSINGHPFGLFYPELFIRTP
ncbi:hypothetical protein H1C71_018552, partial [Ictidomys tridecemlineatus]